MESGYLRFWFQSEGGLEVEKRRVFFSGSFDGDDHVELVVLWAVIFFKGSFQGDECDLQ